MFTRPTSAPGMRRLRLTVPTLVALIVAVVIVFTALVSARVWAPKITVPGKPWFAQYRGQAAQGKPTPAPLQAEVITIRHFGFEPAQITRPQKGFLLILTNFSGYENLALRLDRVAGERLREVLLPRNQLHWDEVLDLLPGNYVLTEAAHPGWICRITITAR